MQVIEFKSAVVARDEGRVLIALFDGASTPIAVALLWCGEEAAGALAGKLGSVTPATTTGAT